MKTMSRVRVTSTSGVVLTPPMSSSPSALGSRRRPWLSPPRRRGRAAPRAARRCSDSACATRPAEVGPHGVVDRHRRDRDGDAEAGGDQRLADGRHDRGVVGGLGGPHAAELVEGLDDADDGAEQPDERADVADGEERREARRRSGPARRPAAPSMACSTGSGRRSPPGGPLQAGPQHVAHEGVALHRLEARRRGRPWPAPRRGRRPGPGTARASARRGRAGRWRPPGRRWRRPRGPSSPTRRRPRRAAGTSASTCRSVLRRPLGRRAASRRGLRGRRTGLRRWSWLSLAAEDGSSSPRSSSAAMSL